MQLVDAGMLAFAAWHALKGRVDRPLTFQVPRMLRSLLREAEDTYALFWNARRLRKRERRRRAGAGGPTHGSRHGDGPGHLGGGGHGTDRRRPR